MKRMVTSWAAAAALALACAAQPALAATRTETLKNGSKLEIEDGKVYTLETPDARKNTAETKIEDRTFRMRKPAPDGTYTLKSGKTIEVKNGELVEDKSAK